MKTSCKDRTRGLEAKKHIDINAEHLNKFEPKLAMALASDNSWAVTRMLNNVKELAGLQSLLFWGRARQRHEHHHIQLAAELQYRSWC